MSSDDIALSVRGLGKSYRIRHQDQNYTRLTEAMMARARHPLHRQPREDLWALQDINLTVPRGEILGIIGHNGAGKSTLLKVLSRITSPTTGRVDVYGRIGSLLEVGTGFHPELTGRENIFLNGTIIGMRHREVQQRFDEIVDYAGVEKFLDTPVKRYSSGMFVRLAFSVAAHLDTDILLVDEVLAVGDASFQRKSLGTMKDVAASGRTVLIVSHNLSLMSSLAPRCVLIAGGRIETDGPTDSVLNHYAGVTEASLQTGDFTQARHPGYEDVEGDLRIVAGELIPSHGYFKAHESISVRLTLRANADVADPCVRFTIERSTGEPVGTVFTGPLPTMSNGAVSTYVFSLDDVHLGTGSYRFSLSAGVGGEDAIHEPFDRVAEVLGFEVAPPLGDGTVGRWLTTWWGSARWRAPRIVSRS